MKKTILLLLLLLILSISILKANSFSSIGIGEAKAEYTDKTNSSYNFISKEDTILLLEYGEDDRKNYRKYLSSTLNSDIQTLAAIYEWAPRFDFFPIWLKTTVGLPSFSIGLGLGYNRLKIENKDMDFISYNLNYNVMFEMDNYSLKIGFNSMDDLQNKYENIDNLNLDTNYIVLQYIY